MRDRITEVVNRLLLFVVGLLFVGGALGTVIVLAFLDYTEPARTSGECANLIQARPYDDEIIACQPDQELMLLDGVYIKCICPTNPTVP